MKQSSTFAPAGIRRRFGSVRSKLILSFLFVILVPSLAIGGFGYFIAKDKLDGQLENVANSDIALVDKLVDQYIQPKMSDVEFLASRMTAAADQELLDNYASAHPEAEQVLYIPATGEALSASSAAETDADPRGNDFYALALESKGTVVLSEPYTSEASGNTVVAIARAAEDGSAVVAVVADLTGLAEDIGEIQIGEDGFVMIVSASGTSIVSPPWGARGEGGASGTGEELPADASGVTAGQEAAAAPDGEAAPEGGEGGPQALFAGDTGEIDQESPGGDSRHLIYITNELTGWKIAGDRSPSEVTKAAAPILSNTILVLVIFVLIGAALMFVIVQSIARPLKSLTNASRIVSEGDLSFRADVNSKDEFGELGASFNRMVDSLRAVVSEVSESSHRLASSSQHLSAGATQTSSAAQHIVEAIGEVADGAARQVELVQTGSREIWTVSEQIRQIVGSAQQASRTTGEVAEKSAEGGQAVRDAVRQMNSISVSVDGLAEVVRRLVDSSMEIGKTIGVISDLSQQTNLLALNAAIEAARAGEEGKGFAVVAGEVRKLAEQSDKSARQVASLNQSIRTEISSVQASLKAALEEVSEGLDVVETAGRLFSEIESYVEEVGGQVRGVSVTAEEIAAGATEVVKAIEDISGVSGEAAAGAQTVSAATEQQLASMEQISSSSASLTRMAVELQSLVDKFKL
ncbi:methyl-accepting chemotaxis protein [Cohnella fermenti]|uniref:HAMP domain-containing protein n=1 Tax=Cohnella fermenti TaxID=2565925 RepID=A0A4S4C2C7_9BACL|nr:methyl-accepting chemotaxis protein [Cohnella fermenti]THF81669.1 HAMP domain-containing protein [Cohnella fermenti]